MSSEHDPEPRSERSQVRVLEIAADDEGQRVDNFLLRELKSVPRSRVYRILRRGEVRVNGKRVKPEYRLATGDRLRVPPVRIDVAPPARKVAGSVIETVRNAIVHEDRELLVVNKPAGLAVHGGSGVDFGVIEALRADRPEESLELVHRLDRETSGLLLVARRRSSLRALHTLMREGRVEKRYLALLAGQWAHGKATIDVPLKTRQLQGGERIVRAQAGGKDAVSQFAPVEFYGKRATLVEVDIETGRTHQIRVHALHAGHPVAGDEKYGDRAFNQEMRELGLHRMFLHATAVSFTWPETEREFNLSVPLDDELKVVLDRLATARPGPRGAARRRAR
ncbi:MAG TPA: RluA family pseudouridine synthase [Steroidobacteraceae bacterium]|nr:RluA family pseudouridine synthase [Steroidobacteraceae bacterium]